MDRPLGRACGCALEVEEALQGLGGEGPDDLMEVTYALGVEMLLLAGVEHDPVGARRRLEKAIASGQALETFRRVVEAQGGDPMVIDDPGILPQADAVEVFRSPATGTVASVDPRIIGRAVVALGGGRNTLADAVDPTVGFVITVKPGDKVKAGQPLASVFARDAAGIALGLDALARAITTEGEPAPLPLVSHRITAAGVETVERPASA
jgi:pyrimidine-nucleoside phosphorylase